MFWHDPTHSSNEQLKPQNHVIWIPSQIPIYGGSLAPTFASFILIKGTPLVQLISFIQIGLLIIGFQDFRGVWIFQLIPFALDLIYDLHRSTTYSW